MKSPGTSRASSRDLWSNVVLVSEEEKRLVTVLWCWKTKTEADRYQEEVFRAALEKLNPMIDSGPVIQYYMAVMADSSTLSDKFAVAA
jgi:hypothetical protein